MAKDKTKCSDCQLNSIDYETSVTGVPVKHGFCRNCFEKRMARHAGDGMNRFRSRRPLSAQENTYETKHGPSHG